MKKTPWFIEIDLFSSKVDSLDDPALISFRELLEDVAEEYGCSLISFNIDKGTVIFSFDSDELMAEILSILQNDGKIISK